MKMCGGDEAELHAYLRVITALCGGKRSVPRPFTSRQRRRAGPKVDLDGAVKRKISTRDGNRTPVIPIVATLMSSFLSWKKNFKSILTSVVRPLYPNADADFPSYFGFKCPIPATGRTAAPLSAVNSDI